MGDKSQLSNAFQAQTQTLSIGDLYVEKRHKFGEYYLEVCWKTLPSFFCGQLKRLGMMPIMVCSVEDDTDVGIRICRDHGTLSLRTTPDSLVIEEALASIELFIEDDDQGSFEIDYISKPSNSYDVLGIQLEGSDYDKAAYEFPVSIEHREEGRFFSFSYAPLLCLCHILEYPDGASKATY